jgi:hypothetical protein
MPRNTKQIPCEHCEKPIDSRGWRVHTLTCKSRPQEQEVETELRQGNMEVLFQYYREGLRDGFQFAGKRAA